jgi:hypothetical protein
MTHSSIVFLVQQLENVYVHYDVMMLEYIQSRSLPSCNSMKPLYEVCLIRIKEQVGEKRSTILFNETQLDQLP